jgi:P pilus assembly chaperone PapD
MRCGILALSVVLMAEAPADAFSLSPTRVIIDEDNETSVVLRLGGADERIAVELSFMERAPDRELTPVPESIIRATPPQLMLSSDESRRVRIDVSKGIAADKSRSFYLRIAELGLNTGLQGSGAGREVVLLSTYLLPIHVLGAHAASLKTSLQWTGGQTIIAVTNSGRGAAILSDCKLTAFLGGDAFIEIDGSRLAERLRSDAVLPAETVQIAADTMFADAGLDASASVSDVAVECMTLR